MFRLISSAFRNDQPIPTQYTGEGKDRSPPLEWREAPSATRRFALLCEDPDAPRLDPFVHWILYDLPSTVSRLGEGIAPQPTLEVPVHAFQGLNSFDKIGYSGPMPPPGHGWHRYIFTLYALNAEVRLEPGANKRELLAGLSEHILAQARLVGKYRREAVRRSVA
jgi:hypothetical protein